MPKFVRFQFHSCLLGFGDGGDDHHLQKRVDGVLASTAVADHLDDVAEERVGADAVDRSVLVQPAEQARSVDVRVGYAGARPSA
mgnify:CR=1 FL=1